MVGAYNSIRTTAIDAIRTVRGAFGDPSSLLRRISSRYRALEETNQSLQRQNGVYKAQLDVERDTNHAIETRNRWLTAQLAEAVAYTERVVEEAGEALQRRDCAMTQLEATVAAKDQQIALSEARVVAAERQYRAAQHWKRDIIEAGHVLLQTRAELEASRSGRAVVFAADHNDRVTYASPKALKLLGYDINEIERADVYSLLSGTDSKNSSQVRITIQREIMENRPEKVSLPHARLNRSEERSPVGANLTIIPIYAGTTYIGTVIRGESKDEKQIRLKAEAAAKKAAKSREQQTVEAELAGSNGALTDVRKWLKGLRPIN